MDKIEEMVTLTLQEWNLRDILKELVISLLQNQKNLLETERKNKMGKIGR
jgi:hypothetical protein